ncbi:MAG: hypothetical protein AB1752_07375 [Candidatus Zixiibacteriota bacterium]
MGPEPIRAGTCPNITARGVRRRLFGAIPSLIVTVAITVFLITADWPRGVRLALVLPYWFSFLGIFQALERTCIVQAARGTRETDDGEAPVEDDSERRAIARQAMRVYVETTVAAVVVTAAIYFS